jgi:hypothetical protein
MIRNPTSSGNFTAQTQELKGNVCQYLYQTYSHRQQVLPSNVRVGLFPGRQAPEKKKESKRQLYYICKIL